MIYNQGVAEKGVKSPASGKTKKVAALGGAIIVVFALGWVFTVSNRKQEEKSPIQSNTQEESSTSETEEAQEPKSTKGLGVSRSQIIAYFEENDLGYIFEPGNPVKDQENMLAVKGTNYAQIIGYEEEPVFASINGYFGSLEKDEVIGFGTFFDQKANDWLENEFQRLEVDGCAGFEGRNELGFIEYTLACNEMAPDQKMLSLSVRNRFFPM